MSKFTLALVTRDKGNPDGNRRDAYYHALTITNTLNDTGYHASQIPQASDFAIPDLFNIMPATDLVSNCPAVWVGLGDLSKDWASISELLSYASCVLKGVSHIRQAVGARLVLGSSEDDQQLLFNAVESFGGLEVPIRPDGDLMFSWYPKSAVAITTRENTPNLPRRVCVSFMDFKASPDELRLISDTVMNLLYYACLHASLPRGDETVLNELRTAYSFLP